MPIIFRDLGIKSTILATLYCDVRDKTPETISILIVLTQHLK